MKLAKELPPIGADVPEAPFDGHDAVIRPTKLSRKVKRLAALLFLSYASLIAIFQGTQNILLPKLVEQLTPSTKVSTLALLSTLAALTTVAALLAGGLVSDRTRSRWGKRTPSLAISGAAGIVALAAMAYANSIAVLTVLMPLTWFIFNYYQSVVTALIPDRIPSEDLGFASAALALGVPVGIFVGVNLSALAPSAPAGYAMLGTLFAIATTCLILLDPEPSSLTTASQPDRAAPAVPARRFLEAFGSRNFSLVFASRFLLFLAYFTVGGYLYYILQDYVGAARLPYHSAAAAVSIVMSAVTVSWLLITPITGILADRWGHTARIVGVTSVAIGVVMLVPTFGAYWEPMLVFGIGLGLTFGIYFAIDLKLVTLVLPSPETYGRDMGIMAVAGSGPTVLAPAIAAGLIQFAGYPALFIFGAAVGLLGGLCALAIPGQALAEATAQPLSQ